MKKDLKTIFTWIVISVISVSSGFLAVYLTKGVFTENVPPVIEEEFQIPELINATEISKTDFKNLLPLTEINHNKLSLIDPTGEKSRKYNHFAAISDDGSHGISLNTVISSKDENIDYLIKRWLSPPYKKTPKGFYVWEGKYEINPNGTATLKSDYRIDSMYAFGLFATFFITAILTGVLLDQLIQRIKRHISKKS